MVHSIVCNEMTDSMYQQAFNFTVKGRPPHCDPHATPKQLCPDGTSCPPDGLCNTHCNPHAVPEERCPDGSICPADGICRCSYDAMTHSIVCNEMTDSKIAVV